jgi:ABC-2 type transport system ATP-binding protein
VSAKAVAEPAVSAPECGVAAVSLEHISKSYTKRGFFGRAPATVLHALRDISFSVREGETLGLLGPNGAGKTTLLKIVSTLLYPTGGRVLFHGRDTREDPVWARRMIGLIACDERSFYWRLTGRQNLSFFACLFGLPKRVEEQRIAELLDRLGLTDAADRPYHSYSSGMRQKMAIARGLLSEPRIALYDEPTRSLDPLSASNIRNWILANRSRWPHQVRILATNQLNEAELLCDRIVIVNKGSIIAQGTVPEVRERWDKRDYEVHRIACRGLEPGTRPAADVERGLLSIDEEDVADGAVTLRVRTRKDSDGLSLALASILGSGGTVLRCQTEQAPFDEVFCSLLGARPEETP